MLGNETDDDAVEAVTSLAAHNVGSADQVSMENYSVDFAVGAGLPSRWNLVQAILKQPFCYTASDRRFAFTSAPLAASLTISGTAVLQLRMQLQPVNRNAAVFVYLEDVALEPVPTAAAGGPEQPACGTLRKACY